MHVHLAHPDGEAKFWLLPKVSVAKAVGLSGRQIQDAQGIVEAHIEEITDAWIKHFGA